MGIKKEIKNIIAEHSAELKKGTITQFTHKGNTNQSEKQ